MKTFLNLALIIFYVALIGCSTTQEKGGNEAEVLFKEIKENYKNKRFLLALEKVSTFRSKFPYSFYVTEIELLRADIYFQQENYMEAVDAYLSFKDFHPKYKKMDVIEWRIAESFFKQLPDTVDRDISSASSAITSYNDLVRKYPKSEYSLKAAERIDKLEAMIEDKELYIADFYFRTSDYQSASYRYRSILKNAKSIETLKKSAKNLFLSYIQLSKKNECLEDLSSFGQFLDKENSTKFQNVCSGMK